MDQDLGFLTASRRSGYSLDHPQHGSHKNFMHTVTNRQVSFGKRSTLFMVCGGVARLPGGKNG
jgi:hypothetical protein